MGKKLTLTELQYIVEEAARMCEVKVKKLEDNPQTHMKAVRVSYQARSHAYKAVLKALQGDLSLINLDRRLTPDQPGSFLSIDKHSP